MRYILFHKPYGVLSQFTDPSTLPAVAGQASPGHPTLKDFINVPDVYAAGRLDRDSEGLLLLTDDGALIRHLSDPKDHVEKTYLVLVEGDPTPEKLATLAKGVVLAGSGYRTLPCGVYPIPAPDLPLRSKPVTPHGPTSWLEIRLREGKKRQIRHMTAAVGLFTLRLIRVAIGPLKLENLPPGVWRELTGAEIRQLKGGKVHR